MRQLTLWEYQSFLEAEEKYRPTEEEKKKAYIWGAKQKRGRPSTIANEQELRRCHNKNREYRRYSSFERYLNTLERSRKRHKREQPTVYTTVKAKENETTVALYWRNRINTIIRRVGSGRCSLTVDFLIELHERQSFCPIFGTPLLLDKETHIDRIDSTGDYTQDNVQLLSSLANRMKSDATPEQLKTFAAYYS